MGGESLMPKIPEWKTGVYCIKNRRNGKVYVGSAAVSLLTRLRSHRGKLRLGNHLNNHLQSAWNKYGGRSFSFSILERCSPSKCVEREQYWIDKLNAADREFGYNKSPTAGSPLGVKHSPEYGAAVSARNLRMSAETRAKIGAASRGRVKSSESRERTAAALRGRKRPPEVVAKITASLKGKKRSPEVRAKIAEANRNRVLTPELRHRMGIGNRDREQSPDIVEKRAAALRGRKRPQRVVDLVATSNRGKKRSDAARANISKAQKKRFENSEERAKAGAKNLGRKLSEAHKAKIRAGQLKPETLKKKSEAAKRQWEKLRARGLTNNHGAKNAQNQNKSSRKVKETRSQAT